jgi:GTPase SAR1 family protein
LYQYENINDAITNFAQKCNESASIPLFLQGYAACGKSTFVKLLLRKLKEDNEDLIVREYYFDKIEPAESEDAFFRLLTTMFVEESISIIALRKIGDNNTIIDFLEVLIQSLKGFCHKCEDVGVLIDDIFYDIISKTITVSKNIKNAIKNNEEERINEMRKEFKRSASNLSGKIELKERYMQKDVYINVFDSLSINLQNTIEKPSIIIKSLHEHINDLAWIESSKLRGIVCKYSTRRLINE